MGVGELSVSYGQKKDKRVVLSSNMISLEYRIMLGYLQ